MKAIHPKPSNAQTAALLKHGTLAVSTLGPCFTLQYPVLASQVPVSKDPVNLNPLVDLRRARLVISQLAFFAPDESSLSSVSWHSVPGSRRAGAHPKHFLCLPTNAARVLKDHFGTIFEKKKKKVFVKGLNALHTDRAVTSSSLVSRCANVDTALRFIKNLQMHNATKSALDWQPTTNLESHRLILSAQSWRRTQLLPTKQNAAWPTRPSQRSNVYLQDYNQSMHSRCIALLHSQSHHVVLS